jgi:ABC-type multidrug transport system ATPase subunit
VGLTDPLVRAENLRLDDAGGPAVERLSIATTGACIAFVGAPRALFRACAGVREVTAGDLHIAGELPRDAVRSARMASAPVDVPVPPRWTLAELAIENARLSGRSHREAKLLAARALESLNLASQGKTRLGAVTDLSVKRAAMLAAAFATGAEVLIVEDFTTGLADGEARALAKLFVAACENRRWIFFAGRLALSSPIGLHADEAVLFAGGRMVSMGMPADIATRERTFTLRTEGDATAFAAKLRERGARVEPEQTPAALTVTMPEDLTTHEMVAIARASNVVVLELLPMSAALS